MSSNVDVFSCHRDSDSNRLTQVLNTFACRPITDQSCRGKIAELNEKVTHLERQIDFLEASINGQAATSVSAVGGGDVRLQQQPQPQHPSVGIVMQTPQQQGQAQQ